MNTFCPDSFLRLCKSEAIAPGPTQQKMTKKTTVYKRKQITLKKKSGMISELQDIKSLRYEKPLEWIVR